jgi:hypothetical protein
LEALVDILKKHWNYDGFRPQQLAVIESILAGKDTLANRRGQIYLLSSTHHLPKRHLYCD